MRFISILLSIPFLLIGCSVSEEENDELFPRIATTEVSNIAQNSVSVGGVFLEEGRVEITDKGIVWGPINTPTLEGNEQSAGSEVENFTLGINGLEPNTTYFVRAYVSYRAGNQFTAFGEIKEFTTLE